MNNNKIGLFGIVVVAGMLAGLAGSVRGEEPALNVQLPAAAPVLETGVVTPVQTNAIPPATNHVAKPAVVSDEVKPVSPVVIPATVVVVPSGVVDQNEAWKSASWQVGTRFLQVKLQDNKRGTPGDGSFFGTITQINEKQDEWPNKVYLQYRLFDSPFWLGVSYDHVLARTMDDLSLVPDGSGSDGDEEIQGVIPYLHAAWDNSSRFTPYAQAGIGFYHAKFLPNSWGDNGMRWVSAKGNVMGVELGGGLNVRIYKNLSADLFAKYMKVDDITGDWYYAYGVHGGPFVMTMSYVAYGAGVSWRF